jgi:hypothetical protein
VHYDRTVIAYHGCDATTAERLLAGEPFQPSQNAYDWLGWGIYFWEYGADRARRFAAVQQHRGKVTTPAVVGALVQLGRCFDLMDTRFTTLLAQGYALWDSQRRAAGKPLPQNKGATPDRTLRHLDCAVLNWFLDYLAVEGMVYDTVRCGFTEGAPVYPGAGIYQQSHVQLVVRNPRCLVGVFRPIVEEEP